MVLRLALSLAVGLCPAAARAESTGTGAQACSDSGVAYLGFVDLYPICGEHVGGDFFAPSNPSGPLLGIIGMTVGGGDMSQGYPIFDNAACSLAGGQGSYSFMTFSRALPSTLNFSADGGATPAFLLLGASLGHIVRMNACIDEALNIFQSVNTFWVGKAYVGLLGASAGGGHSIASSTNWYGNGANPSGPIVSAAAPLSGVANYNTNANNAISPFYGGQSAADQDLASVVGPFNGSQWAVTKVNKNQAPVFAISSDQDTLLLYPAVKQFIDSVNAVRPGFGTLWNVPGGHGLDPNGDSDGDAMFWNTYLPLAEAFLMQEAFDPNAPTYLTNTSCVDGRNC